MSWVLGCYPNKAVCTLDQPYLVALSKNVNGPGASLLPGRSPFCCVLLNQIEGSLGLYMKGQITLIDIEAGGRR